MKEIIIRMDDEYMAGLVKQGYVLPELIRCKDCKHRPIKSEEDDYRNGVNLEFPDERCPCQCEDTWYSWMPDDNWHCGNGERKEE